MNNTVGGTFREQQTPYPSLQSKLREIIPKIKYRILTIRGKMSEWNTEKSREFPRDIREMLAEWIRLIRL
jgi:hypothetical protein